MDRFGYDIKENMRLGMLDAVVRETLTSAIMHNDVLDNVLT